MTKQEKILLIWCGDECAYPDCTQSVVANETELSDAKVIGEIAHIYARNDGGPRSNPDMTDKERNSYKNLIVLCPTHHTLVDGQPKTYTAEVLLKWKSEHEEKVRNRRGAITSNLGHAELEVAAGALLTRREIVLDSDINILSIKNKIERNNLSSETEFLIQIGTPKSAEVGEYLKNMTQIDEKFPDRLRGGFVSQYNELLSQGMAGDELFSEMWMWAGGDNKDETRKLAGLCILTHLFIICDVFEK